MDFAGMDNSTSFAPLNPSSDSRSSSSPSEAPSRPSGGSFGFRSNSFPKTSFASDVPTSSSKSGPSAWARNFQSWASSSRDAQSPLDSQSAGIGSKSGFNLFNNIGFHKQTSVKIPVVEVPLESTSAPESPSQEISPFNSLKTGFLNTSRNAVKAVQTKARHLVSQNKRRYQEGGFDLDLSYITENIIAMGFPAGDMSSGFFGYVEGLYRNHMEEVIKFLETQHQGKYKVYNLCSERLYDAALFEGKVASFPFDDHNCPQLQMVAAFCHSAYSWLRGDLENVVVIHCKAGMARTGLMISCLLLYLKFFPTCEESISFYNQKRCTDGKGLVLPSQLRYVKYFERVLREFDGDTPIGRKCILRGIRLHRCPYWIRPSITIMDHNGVLFSSKKHPRTKDMMSEDIWFSAPRKGVMVFALPGERCIADLDGDFKVLFTDRHGDFYCWLNTNMMESRQLLLTSDLDGFDKRRLPSPGFQVEVVVLDYGVPSSTKSRGEQRSTQETTEKQSGPPSSKEEILVPRPIASNAGLTQSNGKGGGRESIFSDSDGEDDQNSSKGEVSKEASIQNIAEGRDVAIPCGDGPEVKNASNSIPVSTTPGDGFRTAIDSLRTSPEGGPTVASDRPPPYNVAKAQLESINEKVSPQSSSVGAQESISSISLNENVGISKGGEQSSHLSDHVNLMEEGTDTLGKNYSERDGKRSFRGPGKEASQYEKAGKTDSSVDSSDFRAIAADASVFTFGDDEDFESDED